LDNSCGQDPNEEQFHQLPVIRGKESSAVSGNSQFKAVSLLRKSDRQLAKETTADVCHLAEIFGSKANREKPLKRKICEPSITQTYIG